MMMMVYARDRVGGNEYAYSLGTTATIKYDRIAKVFYTSVF
jgi:hypothetical protein